MTNNQFIEICNKYLKDKKKKFNTKYENEIGFLYASFKKYCLEFFLNENEEKHIFEWLSNANYSYELITEDLEEETNIVKKVCTELGITQKELAEIMKINDVTVRNWSSKGQIPDSSIAFMELILENQKIIKENQEMKQALSILKKYS